VLCMLPRVGVRQGGRGHHWDGMREFICSRPQPLLYKMTISI
jgi:hypothetical protein